MGAYPNQHSQENNADYPAICNIGGAAANAYPQQAKSPDLGSERHSLLFKVVFDIGADIPLAQQGAIETRRAAPVAKSRQQQERSGG